MLADKEKSSLLEFDESASGRFCLLGTSFLIHLLGLVLPLTMMQVYDRILVYESTSTLTWLVIGCIVAVVLECFMRYLRSRLGHLLAARFDIRSSKKVSEHLFNSDLKSFENVSADLHLERVNSLSALRNFYGGQIYQVLLDIPFALLFYITIWYLAGPVVILPLFAGLAYIGLVFYCRSRFEGVHQEEVDANEQKQSFLMQLLNNLPTIKGLNMEEHLLRRYERLQFKKVNAQSGSNVWSDMPGQLGPTFSQFTMFGTILLCAQRVLDGDMTLGGLTACMMISGRALQPLQASASFWLKLPAIDQSQERIRKIEELPKSSLYVEDAHAIDIEGEIRFKDFSFRYSEDTPLVLDGINLHIPARATIGITGPSKNGSTTLLLSILNQFSAESGSLSLDGRVIGDFSSDTLRGKIQYLPRDGVLFKGSILDNLTSFKNHRQSLALTTSQLLGLDPLITHLPQGYETQVDARSRLPSDLVQRISLVRSLVRRPRVLLVDKTTSSMDVATEEMFVELLHKLSPLCTIVMVTQWPVLLGMCERVYELKEGRLQDTGRLGESKELVVI